MASSDMEKAEVLKKRFASVFTGGQVPHVCQDPEPLGVGERSGFHPTVTTEQVGDVVMKLNAQKSMGPDDIHPERDGYCGCQAYLKNHGCRVTSPVTGKRET